MTDEQRGTTRRELLRDAGGLTVALMASSMLGQAAVAIAVEPGARAFLSESELRTLRALVDTFIPADADGGGAEGGCAEAIDALLGAFAVDPPRIYAGAPFSDRAGSEQNHFAEFLRLDPYEERGWRLRIEGSGGKRELERNGAVKGWQTTYREGLAALAAQGFADAPEPLRELILRGGDPAVDALVEIAWPHTWQLMYGAPEYGANKDLLGWRYTVYQGDVQPRGWSREEVEAGPVEGGSARIDSGPLPLEELLAFAALGASPELAHNLIVRSDGNMSALRDELAPILDYARRTRGGR